MALDLKLEDTFTFRQGEKKNRDKMILSFYRKEKLTLEDIADAAEVSVQYVKDLIASPQNETKTVSVEKKDSNKLKK
jgi:hypothetical protein